MADSNDDPAARLAAIRHALEQAVSQWASAAVNDDAQAMHGRTDDLRSIARGRAVARRKAIADVQAILRLDAQGAAAAASGRPLPSLVEDDVAPEFTGRGDGK